MRWGKGRSGIAGSLVRSKGLTLVSRLQNRNMNTEQTCSPADSRRGTDTVPLAVLGTVVDCGRVLGVEHSTLPAGLLAAGWQPAFHLGQPGLQAKSPKTLV